MMRVLVGLVVAILVLGSAGLALVVGYWPERQRRQALERQLSDVQIELEEAVVRVRLGDLLGQLLALEDAVTAQDYGQAQAMASTLFDAARVEAVRLEAGPSRVALEQVVKLRDPVTAGRVEDAEALVRDALGYPRHVLATSTDELVSASASGG